MEIRSKSNGRIRVLVVDDNPSIREVVAGLLSDIGLLEVAGTAANGLEALGMLPALRPDLVLTDIVMPVMNGIETTRAIKRLAHPPKVLVMTMHDDPVHRQAALAAGADGFLEKSELTAKLPAAIDALFLNGRP